MSTLLFELRHVLILFKKIHIFPGYFHLDILSELMKEYLPLPSEKTIF